jgi:hypothetical protein
MLVALSFVGCARCHEDHDSVRQDRSPSNSSQIWPADLPKRWSYKWFGADHHIGCDEIVIVWHPDAVAATNAF